MREATFVKRLNRFLGLVLLEGAEALVHITDSGRLRELLIPGAKVFLLPAANPKRKTRWTLAAVEHQGVLVSLLSTKPNALVARWLEEGKIMGFEGARAVKREVSLGSSRFDLQFELGGKTWLAEVKACTLVKNGVALFPDAPTQRGRRHILELAKLLKEGFGAAVFFVVQRPDARAFSPNWETDPDFSEALAEAAARGVTVKALLTKPSLEGETELLGEIQTFISRPSSNL